MPITPPSENITTGEYHEIRKYSLPLRLWHWLNAIVITGSLLTVLLNSTFLSSKDNTDFIKTRLQSKGATITSDQAKSVAHGLSNKVWEFHTYLGYTLAGLLLLRLLLEFFQLADQRLMRKIKVAYRQYYVIKKQRELAMHEFLVKSLYGLFYLMITVMAVTGLCLAFEDDYPVLKSMHFIRQIHGFTMYLIIGFIVLHIGGVLLAERKEQKGIVSDMINGGQ